LPERRIDSSHDLPLAVEIGELFVYAAVQPQVVVNLVKLGAGKFQEKSTIER
jgi:hypothetical protein